MSAILALAVCALLPEAGAADPPACDSATLTDTTAGRSALERLLNAGHDWNSVSAEERNAAIAILELVIASCDTHKEMMQPQGTPFDSIYLPLAFGDKPFTNALEYALGERKQTAPATLGALLTAGASGGIQLPQRFQLGLSQVISAGEPGFALGGAGRLNPTSQNWFLRHSGLTLNALAIQPTRAPPQFASGEIAYAVDNVRTAYDVTSAFSGTLMDDFLRAEHQAGFFATQLFLRRYADARIAYLAAEATQPDQDPNKKSERNASSRRLALEAASGDAIVLFKNAVRDFILQSLVDPEFERQLHPFRFTFAMRLRVSPQPMFVPELPDMLAAAIESAGDGALTGGAVPWLKYSYKAQLSFSAYPTRLCTSFDCDAKATLLGDAAFGLVLTLPAAKDQSPTVVRASGLIRYTPFRSFDTDQGSVSDLSGGFSASLAVPVTGGFALVGVYTLRWIRGATRVATTGLTIAKDIP